MADRIFELYRGGGHGTFVVRGEPHVGRPRRGEMLDAVVAVAPGEEDDAFDALRTTSPRGADELPDVGLWREVVEARRARENAAADVRKRLGLGGEGGRLVFPPEVTGG